jgi:8-oxo-dGTP diphosphatase
MSKELAPLYMITGHFADRVNFQVRLKQALESGPRVVQLRCKGLDDEATLDLASLAKDVCHAFQAPLLLATTPELFAQTEADGLHLSSDKLTGLSQRPIASNRLLSISCHSEADLQLADRLGADILLLSPVKPTSSHADLAALGWDGFRQMIQGLEQPVYGLGGMKPEDVAEAQAAGARGIAATAGLWD